MKKTIITSALAYACASVAVAETTSPALTDAVIQEATLTETFLHVGSTDNKFAANNYTMMLVIDMDKLNELTIGSTETYFVGVYNKGQEAHITADNQSYSGLALEKSTTGTYTLTTTWQGGTGSRSELTLGTTSSSGKFVVTLAVGASNDDPTTLYVYNGTTTTKVEDAALRSSAMMQAVYFKDSTIFGAVDSIYVFKEKLGESDIQTLSAQLVPEPATTTLSLLALAGLAARRRRK